MHLTLTKASVGAISERLLNAFPGGKPAYATSMEATAHILGFNDHIELLAHINRPKSFTCFLEAFSTDGDSTSPEWASFEVTPEFLETLNNARAACKMLGFSAVTLPFSADWGDGHGDEEYLRVETLGLHVKPNGFHLEGLPRHGEHSVATRSFAMSDFFAFIEGGYVTSEAVHFTDGKLFHAHGESGKALYERLLAEEVLEARDVADATAD